MRASVSGSPFLQDTSNVSLAFRSGVVTRACVARPAGQERPRQGSRRRRSAGAEPAEATRARGTSAHCDCGASAAKGSGSCGRAQQRAATHMALRHCHALRALSIVSPRLAIAAAMSDSRPGRSGATTVTSAALPPGSRMQSTDARVLSPENSRKRVHSPLSLAGVAAVAATDAPRRLRGRASRGAHARASEAARGGCAPAAARRAAVPPAARGSSAACAGASGNAMRQAGERVALCHVHTA